MKLIQTVKRRLVGEDKAASPVTAKAFSPSSSSSPRKEAPIEASSFASLPKLSAVRSTECQDLFAAKLQLCSVVYDLSDSGSQLEKDCKRDTLLELVEYVNHTRNCFNEATMSKVVSMVSANVFRPLPYHVEDDLQESDEPKLETSWPHLQLVYEFFLRFVVSNDIHPKMAKRFVDQRFISELIEMFGSEDPRERDYLKTILHRIYGRFMSLRSRIRQSMQAFFAKLIYENAPHLGVIELLEVLSSIINGFALPLKLEHKELLIQILIPMHKVKSFPIFHQALLCCVGQYCDKEPQLACEVIMWLLRHWPVGNALKQVLFLQEVEEILGAMEVEEFQQIQEPLAKRIGLCISSPHFQVSERVLFFWNNTQVSTLIMQHREELWPFMIGALVNNNRHWHAGMQTLSLKVVEVFMEAAPELFYKLLQELEREEEAQEEERREALRADRWSALQKMHDEAQAQKAAA